jgi:CheY-like chemotaxis protein
MTGFSGSASTPISLPPRALEVLLVEDSPGDVRLAQEALKDVPADTHISVAENGTAALDFLHRRDRYDHAPRLDLILLDLDMPGLNGREVLRLIKSDLSLEGIPVVVITGSQANDDVQRTCELHTMAYLNKPMDPWQLLAIVHALLDLWRIS